MPCLSKLFVFFFYFFHPFFCFIYCSKCVVIHFFLFFSMNCVCSIFFVYSVFLIICFVPGKQSNFVSKQIYLQQMHFYLCFVKLPSTIAKNRRYFRNEVKIVKKQILFDSHFRIMFTMFLFLFLVARFLLIFLIFVH